MARQPEPVRVTGTLDSPSRWLWLVKWLLLLPHLLVLAALWLGFVLVVVVAFFAILVTGRYPRPLFDYTTGVLRWSWRVHYYGYAALGTDRYPPFTLADVPDYPARLHIAYPERLSRGLVLVKWILAVPHYLVVGLLAGGGLWLAGNADTGGFHWGAGGLVGVLTLVAGVVLLVRGEYPTSLHDLVVGLDRWVLRVAAYTALLTDRYPPFRLDLGADETGAPAETPHADVAPAVSPRPGWTPGRVVAMVVGVVVALSAVGLLTGGIGLVVADRGYRDQDGYLHTATREATSNGYAVVVEHVDLARGTGWPWMARAVGEVSIRVDAGERPVFVGLAPAARARGYLTGVDRTVLGSVTMPMHNGVNTRDITGDAPRTPPAAQSFWTVTGTGSGVVRLDWTPIEGDWTVVLMNADASAGVDARVSIGATAPALPWLAAGLFTAGAVLLAGGVALVVGAARRATPNHPLRTAQVDDEEEDHVRK